jgi:hypothetical protein
VLDDTVVIGGVLDDPVGPPCLVFNIQDGTHKMFMSAGSAPLGLVRFGAAVVENRIVVYGGSEWSSRIAWNAIFAVTLPPEVCAITKSRSNSLGVLLKTPLEIPSSPIKGSAGPRATKHG